MASPDIATRLLLASDDALADEARMLATQLNEENIRRQQEEAAIVAAARKVVESDPEVGARSVLVVAGEGWHRGVIGIVASKLVDAYHRPAIVLSIEGEEAHGSCRSIPTFDMLAALESCAPMLDRFGGHKVAAGLALPRDRVREFRLAVNAFADERLSPDDLRPRQRIDDALSFRDLTGQVAADVMSLAPFGAGNPKPVFAAHGVEIVDGPRRLKERHLKMALRQNGRVLRAIAWRGVDRYGFLEGCQEPIDLAYSLEQNEFNGETYLELVVADVRPAAVPAATAAATASLEPAS
jgi:single-stranded-DNA-specific exonuclease